MGDDRVCEVNKYKSIELVTRNNDEFENDVRSIVMCDKYTYMDKVN